MAPGLAAPRRAYASTLAKAPVTGAPACGLAWAASPTDALRCSAPSPLAPLPRRGEGNCTRRSRRLRRRAGPDARGAVVVELRVRGEVLGEFRARDGAEVAEVDLREAVAVLVLDVAGHVEAVKEIVDRVDAGDRLGAEEEAPAGLEDERLLPER